MKIFKKVAYPLVIVGSLNWGLVGLFNFNLVTFLVGGAPTVERLVYLLVGISALVVLFARCKCDGKCDCNTCK
jgi:uncharacterized membrane protein YuzA (DUF378 family)